ncbi:LOW QUALITY PROTEIN: tetraspanin-16 [Lycaon pictus]
MAEMHTLYSSLKRLLSFFNGFIVMSNVILIGLGYVKFRGAVLTRVLGPSSAYLVHVGYLCLAIGCITVLLGFSFAGWYGATRESRGTLLYVQEVALEHIFVTLRKNYRGYGDPDDYSTEWSLAMEKLKCCGVKNYTDFCGFFEMTTGPSHPRSCHKSSGRQTGCFPKLLKITKTQSFMGAAVIQLPGILATLLLFIKLG